MSVDYPRSESGYDYQVERVARGVGVDSAGAAFLASFAGALKDTLGREPLR